MEKTRGHGFDSILALALFLFVLATGITDIWETDAWWHLAAGRRIVEKQSPTPADAFSHTQYGRPFVNDEWLGDAYLYGIFQRQGRRGLIIAVGLFAAAAFYLVFGACKQRGVPAPLAVAVTAIGAVAARTRFSPRPEILSLLFFSLILYLLGRFARSAPDDARARKLIWLVPVFQMLWVNAHPSGLAGVCAILLTIAAGAAAFLLTPRNAAEPPFTPALGSYHLRALGTLFAISLGFSLCNPYFIHGLTAPLSFSQQNTYLSHIVEWTPIRSAEIAAVFTPGAVADPQIISFLILAALGVFGLIARGRRQDLFDAVLFAATLFMALRSRRFIALFAVASCPGIAAGLFMALRGPLGRFTRLASPARALTLVFIAALAFQQVCLDTRFHFGTGVSRKFPMRALEFIRENHIRGRMYNDFGLGGFIIWTLYPDNPVFMDGRTTFYGPKMFDMQHRFTAQPSIAAWRRIENKYEIDYAILSSREPHQCNVFRVIRGSSPQWKLVFWDDRAMVLVKDKKDKSSAKLFEYQLANPCAITAASGIWRDMPPETFDAFMAELKRSLRNCPDNLLALRALAFVEFGRGKTNDAERYALRGVQADPNSAFFHAMLGQIALLKNNKQVAEMHLRKAERIDKRYRRNMKRE